MEEVLWLPALPKLMCVALEDNASHIKHFINPHLAHVRPLSASLSLSPFLLAHFTVEQARQLFILFFLSSAPRCCCCCSCCWLRLLWLAEEAAARRRRKQLFFGPAALYKRTQLAVFAQPRPLLALLLSPRSLNIKVTRSKI